MLAAPFICVALGLPHSRSGRRAGDLLVLVLAALSAIPVGIELARWNSVLLPYVPQLPVEWAALAVAVTAWLAGRKGTARRRAVAELATLTTWAAAAGGVSRDVVRAAPSKHRQHYPVEGGHSA